MIKKQSDIPFYEQIKSYFIEEIESGKLIHGDKLPSEREIAEVFNISRMTARHALSVLEKEGFVERIDRSGTFVKNKRINVENNVSFTNLLLSKGYTPTTQILEQGIIKAKESLAKALEIDINENIFFIKKLRYADGMPISIQLTQIPYKYCKGIEKTIQKEHSVHSLLEEQFGIELVKTKQILRLTFSNEGESKLLKIPTESPCILTEETSLDILGRSIEFSRITTRSDLVQFYSETPLKKTNSDR